MCKVLFPPALPRHSNIEGVRQQPADDFSDGFQVQRECASDHKVVKREDPQEAASVELAQRAPASLLPSFDSILASQQDASDQASAQGEEESYPSSGAIGPANRNKMMDDDSSHCERPQFVQLRHASERAIYA